MPERTRGGEIVTSLILKLLGSYSALHLHGKKITAAFGQTPARWQVLGGIEEDPLTVSQIARRMGITRQATQRVAHALRADGLVEFVDNPDHVRSPKIKLTIEGKYVLKAINSAQAKWANEVAKHLDIVNADLACGTLDNFVTALNKTERSFFPLFLSAESKRSAKKPPLSNGGPNR